MVRSFLSLATFSFALLMLVTANLLAEKPDDNTVEMGAVKWGRDLAAAQKISAQTQRPIFTLFQEIPG